MAEKAERISKLHIAIVEYLEKYNQPQFSHAIAGALAEQNFDTTWVQAEIDQLVADGAIKTVDGGVDSGGNPQVMYAPNGFEE